MRLIDNGRLIYGIIEMYLSRLLFQSVLLHLVPFGHVAMKAKILYTANINRNDGRPAVDADADHVT